MKYRFRKLTAAALLLVLSGCTQYSSDIVEVMNEKLREAGTLKTANPVFNSTYYKYYVQPYIGRIDSDLTSNVFSLNGTQFILNLDVPAIINSSYYPAESPGTFSVEGAPLMAEKADTYEDNRNQNHTYICRIYRSEQTYYTILTTKYAQFFARSTKYEAPVLAGEMLYIARCIEPDRNAILRDFSNHTSISYQKEKLELFQNIIPENGVIDELFVDHDETEYDSQENDRYTDFSEETIPPEPSPDS